MRITLRARNLLQWLMLCIGIGAGPAWAQDKERQHLMEKAGALVWDMLEKQSDFGNRRGNRGMTPEKERKYARKVASQLARSRDRLARLQGAFPAGDTFAGDLTVFLERWPDESAFYESLFAENVKHTDNLGAQLFGLGSQAHDTRRKWKTPFRLFRP
jgi:hypothetical protein